MKIPFVSYERMNDTFREAAYQAFSDVFESRWYILGDRTRQFETEFAGFNQVVHCVGVSNGLDALHLALRALGVGTGDEVIVPSNTFIATALAVSQAGATPVFAEPLQDTCNIDPAAIEAAISSRTKAIIPVHLYGQAADMDAICAIAQRHGLFVIEDNAQAQGASFNGRQTGSIGHINATSFYPGKNLGAIGDAGAVTTNDDTLAAKVQMLRNYGSHKKYVHDVIGYNMRLDELQAALLSAKLKHLHTWNKERQAIAASYDTGLSKTGDLILPATAPGATHVYHLYVVRTTRRDDLQRYLDAAGIQTLIHYPVPPHLQGAYASLGHKAGAFPIAERIADTCLSLPLWPGMSGEETGYVISVIRKFYCDET